MKGNNLILVETVSYLTFLNCRTSPRCEKNIYLFSFATREVSPQQREPITVGPYYSAQPVNFPCGRKPEYPQRKPTTFGRTLTILFSHEDWVRIHIKMNITGDRTRNHYTTEAQENCLSYMCPISYFLIFNEWTCMHN